ncbi:hypothetical protein J7T55_003696 [Diaporthe amygdali]|uniref:uncharacterized protein n=1 Tax=Phomopsis amygdali TaxID=1214568 RepID=UPI0022FF40A8|nr:uncharacterized protein J7T55_003696 [Diaporthe amygdali]KAJ0117285.1 hypothetical protein J7T55_003696 [Diaporthe amygdali]
MSLNIFPASLHRCPSLPVSIRTHILLPARSHTFMGASIACLRAGGKPRTTRSADEIVDKHKAIIISGFCAIGKTHFSSTKDNLQQGLGMEIFDLDSSSYSSKPGFPENYIAEIRKRAEKPCVILISTHRGLPTQLAREGYYVALVYPGDGPEAKREWLRRLEEREEAGKDSRLYKITDENWDLWYGRTAGEEITSRWTLANDQYLSTIFDDIHTDFRKFKRRTLQQD